MKNQFLPLPITIVTRFNRMFGVKAVANKHLKDLITTLVAIRKNTSRYEMLSYFLIDTANNTQQTDSDIFFMYILIQYYIDPQFL